MPIGHAAQPTSPTRPSYGTLPSSAYACARRFFLGGPCVRFLLTKALALRPATKQRPLEGIGTRKELQRLAEAPDPASSEAYLYLNLNLPVPSDVSTRSSFNYSTSSLANSPSHFDRTSREEPHVTFVTGEIGVSRLHRFSTPPSLVTERRYDIIHATSYLLTRKLAHCLTDLLLFLASPNQASDCCLELEMELVTAADLPHSDLFVRWLETPATTPTSSTSALRPGFKVSRSVLKTRQRRHQEAILPRSLLIGRAAYTL
ncbi:hypothetical protein SUNI508_04892 [Seiridium unicorne]|uniref:Uncharacterized protein n=1 Tax=Seiridium unicorne TaxID=138068 RepID=A0ABR2V5N2_9PEZI